MTTLMIVSFLFSLNRLLYHHTPKTQHAYQPYRLRPPIIRAITPAQGCSPYYNRARTQSVGPILTPSVRLLSQGLSGACFLVTSRANMALEEHTNSDCRRFACL
jgi:hypothetical protein